MKKLSKEKGQEAREGRLKLATLAAHRDTAARLAGSIEEHEEKASHTRNAIRTLAASIQDKQETLTRVERQVEAIGKLLTQAAGEEARLQEKRRYNEQLGAKLKEGDLEDTTEELESKGGRGH